MERCYYIILVSLAIEGSWILADQERTKTLLEGDILLTEDQRAILAEALQANSTIEEVEHSKQPLPNEKFIALAASTFPKWRQGVIPYTINTTLGEKERSAIREAIEEWESMTCIRFVERADQPNYLEFFKGDGCWGTIGMGNGKSQISIGEGCGYRLVISHEIGHVVGFFHEQSRVDRDDYIDIKWSNIEEGMESSFRKYTGDSIDSRGIPYDYGSIMHYPWHAMSKNGKDTIVAKKTVVNQPYWKLSRFDAAKTDSMYKEMCQKVSVKPPLSTATPPVAPTQVSTSVESQMPPTPVETTTPGTLPPKTSTATKTSPPTVVQTSPQSQKPTLPLETTTRETLPPKTSTATKTSPPTVVQTSPQSQKPTLPLETTTRETLPPKTSTAPKTVPSTVAQMSQPLKTTRPSPATTSSTLNCEEAKCEDKSKSCRWWKDIGLCERRKERMSEICCKSCKGKASLSRETEIPSTCIADKIWYCKSWAARKGYCQKAHFARLCCKSCATQLDNCKDKLSTCKRFKIYCKEGIYKKYMSRFCCKTCKLGRKSCEDRMKYCKFYQRRGFCTNTTYKRFMFRNCEESCGLCAGAPTKCKVKKKKKVDKCRKISQKPKEGATCNKAVRAGLENRCMNDTALSASSELSSKYGAAKGRLNGLVAWCPAIQDGEQHIMIDLGTVSIVKQIITQGLDSSKPAYVSKFYIMYSKDKKVWGYSSEKIWAIKTYTGNDDSRHETLNEITPPIIARYIRIHPIAWKNRICLRVELGIC